MSPECLWTEDPITAEPAVVIFKKENPGQAIPGTVHGLDTGRIFRTLMNVPGSPSSSSSLARRTTESSELLLKISSLLMTSGADVNRILTVLNRFALLLNYRIDVLTGHKTFVLTLFREETGELLTRVKRLPPHKINFRTLSELGEAGRRARKESWSLERIREEIERIEQIKPYPLLLTLGATGLACAGLTRLFGGDGINMAVTFIAVATGLFIRTITLRKGFNPSLSVLLASFVTSCLTASAFVLSWGLSPRASLVSAVLFLVPGIPMINAFTDFLDGYIMNGMVRSVQALMTLTALLIGFLAAVFLFQIHRFPGIF